MIDMDDITNNKKYEENMIEFISINNRLSSATEFLHLYLHYLL